MTTTPWDEARQQITASVKQALYGPDLFGETDRARRLGVAEIAMNATLRSLSDHGWRLVPAEATEEMERSFLECPSPQPIDGINAATEAGDVLRPGLAEGGGVEG